MPVRRNRRRTHGGPLSIWWQGCAAATGAAAVLLAGAFPSAAGEWLIVPSVTLEEQYTDNVLSAAGDKKSDFMTTTAAGIDINGTGGRTQLSLNYDIARETFLHQSKLSGLRHNALGIGSVDLIDEYVFVEGRASVSEELISRSGAVAATDRATTGDNQTRIVNYSLAPSFRHGNDGWADSILTYRFSQVKFMSTGASDAGTAPGNTTTHELISSLESGRRFSVFRWSGEATTTFESERGEFRSRRDLLEGSGEYLVNRHISLLVTGGHDNISDKALDDVAEDNNSGFFWEAGPRLSPGPRTTLTVQYGQRFDSNNITGDFTHEFSPRTTLQASYEVEIETQQRALSNALNNAILNPQGQLVDPNTGLPLDPNNTGTDLVDTTSRTDRFELGLNGTRGRSTFSISTDFTARDLGTQGDKERVFDVSGSLSRTMSPNLTASVDASFSRTIRSRAGATSDKTLNLGATLGYSFSDTFTSTVSYRHLRQETGGDEAAQRENVISVRLNKTF